jgi:hypothetical protein
MTSSDTITEEKVGFDPNELVACAKCGRKNAPNRLKCMYCAADLEVSADNVKLEHKWLELWENGQNVICVRRPETIADPAAIAKVAGIDAEFLEDLLHSKLPLPIIRVATENEVKLTFERLTGNGIEIEIIGDKSLDAEHPPKRLRAIEFDEKAIVVILFNADEIVEIPAEQIDLIVTGTIFETEIESTELRKLRKGELTEQISSKSKSSVIDIYAAGEREGYRVYERGFDFSCLRTQKGFLAGENMRRLAERLNDAATNTRVETQYDDLRGLLGMVWELEETQNSGGLQRTGMGKITITRSTKQNNLMQFTKYSRMLSYLR